MSVCIAVQPESPSNDASELRYQRERLHRRAAKSPSNDASDLRLFSVSVCIAVQPESPSNDAGDLRLFSVSVCIAVQPENPSNDASEPTLRRERLHRRAARESLQ